MNDKKQFYEDLKFKREEGGFSLEEISDYTKIDIRYLIAIEEGDFSCLPAVYMRLFIRSYCDYIGADSKKALNDYEFFTVGVKPKSTASEKIIENKDETLNSIEDEELNIGQIPTSKIITIAATIVSLFLVFYVISSISSKQSESTPEKSVRSDGPSAMIEANNAVNYREIPNDKTLTNAEFISTNVLFEQSQILIESAPYEFTVIPRVKTKINISNDGKITNKIVDKDEVLIFNVQNEISFDLWSANHVICKLNDTNLNNFFGNKDQSIRGNFSAGDQRLFYKIYKQIDY